MRYELVIAVGLGIIVAGTATAAPITTSPDKACNGRSDEIIGVLPSGEVEDGEIRLYPGSTLSLVLCDDGDAVTTGAWSLQESSGLVVRGESEDRKSYTVTVSEQTSTVSVAELVKERRSLSGLRILLQPGGIVEEELADGSTVSFPEGSMKTTFRQEKGRYLRTEALLEENVTEIRNTTETLNATGGALDKSVLDDVNSSRTIVRNIDEDWATLDSDHTAGLTRLLYNAAWQDRDSSGELRTMRGVLSRTKDTESNVTDALERYRATLEQTERSLWYSVLVDVGIGLLPGLVVGGLLGAWYPHREAKRVAYDRQYSAVDYDWRTLIAPLAASLVIGVAILMVIGLVDAEWLGYLLEVLL